MVWPETFEALIVEQRRLGALSSEPWRPGEGSFSIGACFVCFPRGYGGSGAEGDPAWAGAAILFPSGRIESSLASGSAGGPYRPGLLGLREGPCLEAAVHALEWTPDVLIVNATGLDHPRGAGLAIHLGANLGVPTVGVTHRPLIARGEWPEPRRGDERPLLLEGRRIGSMLCTCNGCRPLAVHAAWRTDAAVAVRVVMAASLNARTPEPLRAARRVARKARAASGRGRVEPTKPR